MKKYSDFILLNEDTVVIHDMKNGEDINIEIDQVSSLPSTETNTFNEDNTKMRIIRPQTDKNSPWTDLSDIKNAIFLAGPCPRSDYRNNDWRNKAFEILDNLCFEGTVITPTNDCYDPNVTDFLRKQTDWEYEAMHRASAIVFCLDRTDTNPGFTTNVEMGSYWDCPAVYVFCPDDNTKGANNYIKLHCEDRDIPVYNTLEDTLAAVVKDLGRSESRNWFISDTHFGQERTLTLSRRPFRTVREMDLTIISNWNKLIRSNDTVYVLGDFGDKADYFKGLNYGKINFVLGNYERDNKVPEEVVGLFNMESDNFTIYKNDECHLESGEFKYVFRHEPITDYILNEGECAVNGHIHGRSMIKPCSGSGLGSIDVGVDCHMYKPVSQEELDFFANALKQGYYDENVFEPVK